MAIKEDLDILGSVSGGCIVGSVISEAQEIMKTGIPKLLKFVPFILQLLHLKVSFINLHSIFLIHSLFTNKPELLETND